MWVARITTIKQVSQACPHCYRIGCPRGSCACLAYNPVDFLFCGLQRLTGSFRRLKPVEYVRNLVTDVHIPALPVYMAPYLYTLRRLLPVAYSDNFTTCLGLPVSALVFPVVFKELPVCFGSHILLPVLTLMGTAVFQRGIPCSLLTFFIRMIHAYAP